MALNDGIASFEKSPKRIDDGLEEVRHDIGETHEDYDSSTTGIGRYTVALGPFKFSYQYAKGRKKHH